jgi:hypothetical protein
MASIGLATSPRMDSPEIVYESSSNARSTDDSATTPHTDWSFLDDELWEVDMHGNVVDLPSAPSKESQRTRERDTSKRRQETVMVSFIGRDGASLRERPWSKCSTMNAFLLQAAASGLFESLDTDICLRAIAGGASVDLVKDDELDFEALCELVKRRNLKRDGSSCGCVEIRFLADLKKSG